MGCVASKLEEEEEVVSICRERKRLLKLAVERRYLLAESHCRYCQSLYAVGAAIRLFVARHSSPSSPFLITFPPPCPPSPPPENGTTNPKFLHQAPSEQAQEAMACDSCGSSTSSGSDSSEECQEDLLHTHRQEHEQEQSCGYYFMPMPMAMPMGPPVVPPPPMASPQRDFGWDFFFPYDGMMRPEVMGGYMRSLDEDLRAVREQEGIPELEEAGDREEEHGKVMAAEENGNVGVESHGAEMVKPVDGGDVNQGEQKGLSAMDSAENGRELLEALKDIEDYFTRAFDSGKDVSKMLEANRVHLQSGLKEIKENSTKLIQAITWHRSASSKASSCKSLVASSSKSSSTWSEDKSDLFDDYGGMASGSHSLTLGRLYAWEKKLYEEVKAGDSTRKLYEKKCSRLQNQGVRGDNELTVDKTRVSVKDLYARILVAIRSAESISKRIQKLRDEELEPQIVELLKGLARTWKIMLESHETQNKILNEVKSFACPSYGKFCNDSHRLATLQLEAELQNWRACFADYISSQRSYVEALNGWLTKFLIPEVEFYPRGKLSAVPYRVNGPPLLVICHDWLAAMDKLPEKAVTYSLKSFSKDVRALWAQQGDEKQQKRKVEGLAKELDRRVLAFQKAENRFLDLQVTDSNPESDIEHSNDYVTDKKDQLDMFRRRLEMEKEKHQDHVRETQRVTLNGFQTGFCAVFESLTEFSKASLKMYNDLVTFSENTDKLSFIEGSEEKEGSR